MTRRTWLLLVPLLLTPACAGRSGTASKAYDRNIITAEQMKDRKFNNLYDAISALRPNWLHTRGTDSYNNPSKVEVYYDNARMEGVKALRTIATSAIAYVRYYNANEATARWGMGHGQGAIYVSSSPAEP